MKNCLPAVQLIAVLTLLAGCNNITGLDNRDAPNSQLKGNVVYATSVGAPLAGKPVNVRNNEVQLELWEPAYFEKFGQLTKIPINVKQDGSFSAVLFDGTYKLNLLANNGPWVTTSDTIQITVNGGTIQDFPVTPHYTVLEESFTRGAVTTAAPGGTVSATFKVGRVNTTRALEFVGLYVGTTLFVDRTNTITGPTTAQKERALAAIQTQVNSNSAITISYNLPENIFQSGSPWVRDFVFVRLGIKIVGLTQMIFTPVYELNLATGQAKLAAYTGL